MDEINQEDTRALRSSVLSYRYEVNRLIDDYRLLKAEYGRVAPNARLAISKYNDLVNVMSQSRIYRLASMLRRALHFLRTNERLQEDRRPIHHIESTPLDSAFRESFPDLPSLPQINYEAKPPRRRLTWDSASFLSFRFYNELADIVAERSDKCRGVFVQTPIIDWFVPLYQRPQHMALAMAKEGYLVFYQTANCISDRANGYHEVAPNVFITNQPVEMLLKVPALYSFYSTAATLLSWQGPQVEHIRRSGGRILYEYIDHIDPEISFHTTDALARQLSIVGSSTVDLALASARSLQEELKGRFNGRVAYVPNGVDVSHYLEILESDRRATVPAGMREAVDSGRPIIGYFGALAPWLWYEVINSLAEVRSDLSFVYIGPDYLGGADSIKPADNVYLLGAVDYAQLPYYAQHFDVCTIPFKPGEIARTTSPLKLFEYFALGKPIVVTAEMSECVRFDEVLAAGSLTEFSEKIDFALELGDDLSFRNKLRKAAADNSWEARAQTLIDADIEIVEYLKERK